MGGIGSGRKGSRTKTEDCPVLDVLSLWKAGHLEPNARGRKAWRHRDGHIVRIGHYEFNKRLVLIYYQRGADGQLISQERGLGLTWSSLPYGGAQPYFLCCGAPSGPRCQRRVIKVYFKNGVFLCRNCHKLTYRSQSETRIDRLNRRADKIRQFLTRDGLPPEWIPARPKGMWHRTYMARIEEIFTLEEAVATGVGDWLEARCGTRDLREFLAREQT